jgi:hypothetical protein
VLICARRRRERERARTVKYWERLLRVSRRGRDMDRLEREELPRCGGWIPVETGENTESGSGNVEEAYGVLDGGRRRVRIDVRGGQFMLFYYLTFLYRCLIRWLVS